MNENEIIFKMSRFFPRSDTIIAYGSWRKGYVPGVSDLDIVVVGPKEDDAAKILEDLHKFHPELDVIYIPKENLAKGDFSGTAFGRRYILHAFDLYRVKKQGEVLF